MVMQMDDFGSGDLENKVDDFEKARAGHELVLGTNKCCSPPCLSRSLISIFAGRAVCARRCELSRRGECPRGSLPAWDNDSRDSLKGTR